MPFLRRRRLSPYSASRARRHRLPSFASQLEWRMSPETTREVIGLVFTVLGLLFLISIFHLAGRFGEIVIADSVKLFGLLGYIAPLVWLAIGVKLLLPRDEKDGVKATVAIGVAVAFLVFPALLVGAGGLVGYRVFNLTAHWLGPVGGYILLLGLAVGSFIVATNLSLSYVWARFKLERETAPRVNVHGAKANVFTLRDPRHVGETKAPRVLTSEEGEWELPPLDLLHLSESLPDAGNINKNREQIQKTLKEFSIEVTMGDVNVGPTVSQYTLKPAEGVKLTAITARQNDIALALAAPSVRIEAPIPGKSAVGVEIPNKAAAVVTLREVLESDEMKKNRSPLALSLGRGAAGEPFVTDLDRMPHLLIAGTTGSGKSVQINSIIINLIYQNSPAQLRVILVDPKRVEFTEYNGIPHLLTPVVIEIDKTVSVLKWVVAEMERRFKLLADSSARNITVYNDNPTAGRLPYIILIIDELADLMAQAAGDVEATVVRIAQMARAVGIHLIVATQRPSVDVITGVIKANIATRIAFAVASNADSRTILDQAGAEKLLGRGDMLYISSDQAQPKRVQSAFVSDKEIKAVTDFLKREGEARYDEEILNFKSRPSLLGGASANDIDDDLYADAKQLVIETGKASASLLQRRLRVGYARAARLLDLMEEQGIIGPADGAKPREVLESATPRFDQDA